MQSLKTLLKTKEVSIDKFNVLRIGASVFRKGTFIVPSKFLLRSISDALLSASD